MRTFVSYILKHLQKKIIFIVGQWQLIGLIILLNSVSAFADVSIKHKEIIDKSHAPYKVVGLIMPVNSSKTFEFIVRKANVKAVKHQVIIKELTKENLKTDQSIQAVLVLEDKGQDYWDLIQTTMSTEYHADGSYNHVYTTTTIPAETFHYHASLYDVAFNKVVWSCDLSAFQGVGYIETFEKTFFSSVVKKTLKKLYKDKML